MESTQQSGLIYNFDLRFPPLSRTVAEVSDLLASSGMPDTDRLLEIVHLDPLVVASVLKRINSAFYGMRTQFQDIRKAILMIGFIEVCNIVLASGYVGLRKTLKTETQSMIIERIMRLSIGSGYYANLFAQHLRLQNKSSAFTAGLLHSIGRFVLLFNLPEVYEKLYQENPEVYIPSAEDERRLLGIDHSSMGALAAQHWNFPPIIAALIESYHTPGQLTQPNQRNIALILALSSSIAQQLCVAGNEVSQHAVLDGEAQEEAIEEEFTPIDIAYPAVLSQLAQSRSVAKEELIELANNHQQEALAYIEMMLRV